MKSKYSDPAKERQYREIAELAKRIRASQNRENASKRRQDAVFLERDEVTADALIARANTIASTFKELWAEAKRNPWPALVGKKASVIDHRTYQHAFSQLAKQLGVVSQEVIEGALLVADQVLHPMLWYDVVHRAISLSRYRDIPLAVQTELVQSGNIALAIRRDDGTCKRTSKHYSELTVAELARVAGGTSKLRTWEDQAAELIHEFKQAHRKSGLFDTFDADTDDGTAKRALERANPPKPQFLTRRHLKLRGWKEKDIKALKPDWVSSLSDAYLYSLERIEKLESAMNQQRNNS